MAADTQCFDANEAVDFADGRLSSEAALRAEEHLSACDVCRALVAEVATGLPVDADGNTMCVSLGGTLAPVGVDGADLDRGAVLGRYVITEVLGRGGMGIVYRAHDPHLERSVALKVMHVERDEDDRATQARARLLREARALAQLQHPNVVAIHDVGTIDDDVFIAMELADGRPLNTWLAETEPDVDAILGAFVAAGTGLAAAHDAGLVHRDFKPANVMVGDDGRVRVLDFGLVREVGRNDDRGKPADAFARTLDDSDSDGLTRTGWVVGTPAYMAPEQYTAGDTDGRTDQFSFCVALYEALYGERPFAGGGARQVATAVIAGRMREPPRSRDVPDRVRHAVVRGLSRKPAERFATMDELLDELRPVPARRRPHLAFVIAGATVIAGVVAVAFAMPRSSSPGDERCKGADEAIAAAWNPARGEGLREAFGGTGRPYAAATADTVTAMLDSYAERWAVMHTQTCEATHVHGTQSERLLDLRMACLDRRRLELDALVAALSDDVDGEIVDGAVRTVTGLSDLTACADAEALARLVPLPDDPGTRAVIAALEADIAGATAMHAVGRYPEGLDLAVRVEAEARDVGYGPTHARALFVLGLLRNKAADMPGAEKALREATTVAARAKDDELTARVWIDLIWVVAYQSRFDEALQLRASAEAALARIGDPPLLVAGMLHNASSVMLVKGDYAGAIEGFERALALREATLGPLSPDVGATLQNLATAQRVSGGYPAAEATIKRAIAAFTESLGPEHPAVAGAMFVLGAIHHDQGTWDRALAAYQAALDVRVAALGEDHPDVAAASERVAAVLSAKGDHDGARRRLHQALDIKRAKLGDEHPHVATTLGTLGEVLSRLGDVQGALEAQLEALAINTASLGPDHAATGISHQRAGEALVMLGREAEATTHFERAVAIFDGGNPLSIGAANFALARVLPADQRARAIELARIARAAYVALGGPGDDEIEAIDAWLAAH